ncbi:MAG: protease modulator HflC [Planctomycetota bacterium]|nr:protease modulator HflC [Planctomycetaceae bacterium]MDQ3332569.1 protease modulator HflC [Planctomycetota bacterium]
MNTSRLPAYATMAFVLLVVLIVAANACLYIVDEREQAVILQFGAPVASRTEPGLYFKAPFVQEVRRLPKTLRFWSSGQEVLKDMPTADGKKIEVSAWAVWRITDPKAFVQNLRTVEGGEAAVMVRLRSAIRDVITAHDLEEVVRSTDRKLTYSFQDLLTVKGQDAIVVDVPIVAVAQPGVSGDVRMGREKIMDLVGQKVAMQIKQEGGSVDRGIELVEVGISNIEFVPQVRLAAFERQKAFMQSIAAGYSNAGLQRKQEIINQTNAEVERLLGEGEQQSRVARGNADAENIAKTAAAIKETGDFYEFVRTLEMYQEALQGKTRLILTTDSDLLRLLKSPTAGRNPTPQATTSAE